MREKLKGHIKSVLEGINHLSVDDAAGLIAEVGDEIAGDDRNENAMSSAILDGLRWGHHAAVVVEMGGGAMMRFVMPSGETITSEWADVTDADQPIRAALAAIRNSRVTATNAGKGEA